jgi:hypothetical protein
MTTRLETDRPDTRLQPDRDEAERFLAALDPNADRFTFQTFDDNKQRKEENLAKWLARRKTGKKDPFAFCYHGTLIGLWSRLVQLNERGVGIFVTVNRTTLEGRRLKENIVSIRALFSDLDGAPLDRVLAEGEPKAHIITETSPAKYHVVWLAADVPLTEFTPTQKVIAERYDSDPQVNDLPRVMRLPGFIHRKGEPFRSRLVQANDIDPYTWAELSKIFRDEWKDYKQPPKQTGGTSNWRDLNTIACARGDDWWQALFPRGAYKSGDTWRVTSKALGRNLQEDIGLHPQYGIRDFGEEKSFTPIDLVMKWLPARDAREAVEWLANKLGDEPRKYLQAIKKGESDAEKILEELNRDDERDIGGESYTYFIPTFLRPADFRMLYLNRRVEVGRTKDDQAITMDVGKWWLGHPKRRQYRGVTFIPAGSPVIDGKLNLWRGWGVEPKKGDWSLMRQHIRDVVAAGDLAVDAYTINWIAWAFQHPDKQAEVAPAFISDGRGTGKGTLGRATCRIFGQHGLHISSPDQLTGKFNDHLRQCAFLFADEAYGPKDKSAEGQLKRLVTEDTLRIEPKGRDSFEIPNRLHVMFASNNDWVVPAGAHERRYVVQRVSEVYRQKDEWFKPLYAEMKAGGLGAMLYDLLRMDLGDWHPRQIVKTAALAEQQDESLSALDAWWVEILHTGELVGSIKDEPNRAVSNNYEEDIEEMESNGFGGTRIRKRRVRREGLFDSARASSPKLRAVTDHAIGRYLKTKGAERDKPKQRRGWRFPLLSQCRDKWCETYPETDWSGDEVDEWQTRAEWDDA